MVRFPKYYPSGRKIKPSLSSRFKAWQKKRKPRTWKEAGSTIGWKRGRIYNFTKRRYEST